MVDALHIAPVFQGFRGLALDPDGLADLLVVVGRIALGLGGRLAQLDLNPVVHAAGGWAVLDARLILTAGPSTPPCTANH